jgi:UDP-N-acetylglucosamine 1-carboxyvinyltransferase
MAASLAQGTTVIRNAASEPHVEDLCSMLQLMGCPIQGIGSNVLRIDGQKQLSGCEFTLGFDYMEAGSFIGLAGASGGEILLKRLTPQSSG